MATIEMAAMKKTIAVLAVLAGAIAPVAAQNYPTKPVRVIVAFPAGGGSDVMGRIVAQKLGEKFGQQVVVDNRGGAGGSIGTEAAVKAPADGYTLQLASTSEVSINRSLYRKLSYDPLRDLAPVGMVSVTPMVLVVHPSMPVANVKQFVALMKARPNEVLYGSAGTGSTTHLAAELFKVATGAAFVHVPYKGAAPAITDLVGGHVQIMFSTLPAVMPMISGKRVKALAVSSGKRAETLPDVPTMAEAGVSGYQVDYWYGLFVPKNTPEAIVTTLNRNLVEGVQSADMSAAIRKQGAVPTVMPLPEMRTFLQTDADQWAQAVKISGATAD